MSLGYIIELFYRRFISQKKWMNPGFMVGPYLPIYGFGAVLFYLIFSIPFNNVLSHYGEALCKIGIVGVTFTLLELIVGSFFLKFFKLRLWDYTDRKLNFKGLICPLFSFFWLLLGGIFYFVYSPFCNLLKTVDALPIYYCFFFLALGIVLTDAAYSFHIGFKVKKALGGALVRYDTFREHVKSIHKKISNDKNKFAFSVFSFAPFEEIKKIATDFVDSLTQTKKEQKALIEERKKEKKS